MKLPRTIKSRWPGDCSRSRLHVLKTMFGNRKKIVLVSFYAAPELVIAVRVDSRLPLDLPDNERFKPHTGIKAFRDLLDTVYDCLTEQFRRPPVGLYRTSTLVEEMALEEISEQSEAEVMWNIIIRNGSTWCKL